MPSTYYYIGIWLIEVDISQRENDHKWLMGYLLLYMYNVMSVKEMLSSWYLFPSTFVCLSFI